MKRVAIVQSSYIPWKGYFDLINQVDEFILLDDVQYTRRDWRNRNRIKTPRGTQWLTIPVSVRDTRNTAIKDVQVADQKWRQSHWRTISQNYAKSGSFSEYADLFEQLYLGYDDSFLSAINFRFIKSICVLLDIRSKISWSMDYHSIGGKTKRLVDLCLKAGASEYVTGPKAMAYLDQKQFEAENIRVAYSNYEGYPAYRQLFCPPFIHEVSVIDLLFNEGVEGAKRCSLTFPQKHHKRMDPTDKGEKRAGPDEDSV